MQRRARRSRSKQIDIDTVSTCDSTATDVSDKENNAVPREDKQKNATQCLLRRNKKASPAKKVFSALSSERKTKNKPMADKSQSTPNRRSVRNAQDEPKIKNQNIEKTDCSSRFNKNENIPKTTEKPQTSPKVTKKQLFNSTSEEQITTNLAPPSPPPTANTVKFDIPISPIAVKKKRERKIKHEKSQKSEDNYHGMSYIDVMFKELEEESVKEKNGLKEAPKRKHNVSGGNKSINKSGDKSADFSFGGKKPRRTSKVVDLTAEQIREIEEFELDIEVVPKKMKND